MSGRLRSSCSARTVLAPMRSCAGPVSRRPVSGAGRNASCRKAMTVSCATRRGHRIRPLGSNITEHVVMLTQADPPAEATHWTSAMMAKVVDISASSVQRIWRAHGLQPHRVKQFKLSTDPQFVGKLRDIVGLYVDPPAHAVVLSVGEKRSHGEWIATDALAE